MVVECQGINYDLMSEIEKTSVESGFIQFLNSIRDPIQLYVQARTINLESSIQNYKCKLETVERELNDRQLKYKQMLQNPDKYDEKEVKAQRSEVIRQKRLYEYGKDIVFNTEKMSTNKNVLRKKYYIILSYYQEDSTEDGYSVFELKDIAFSELYTKCQATIRALSMSGVNGKIMNSYNLVDLLYNAYNRDEAERFGAERAYKAGFNELYATAEDVLDKKIQALDNIINDKGMSLAYEAIEEAKSDKEKQVEAKESNIDKLIGEMAEIIIEENKRYLDSDVAKNAVKIVKTKSKVKEEKNNGKAETGKRK